LFTVTQPLKDVFHRTGETVTLFEFAAVQEKQPLGAQHPSPYLIKRPGATESLEQANHHAAQI
jgi:hypothetical protein